MTGQDIFWIVLAFCTLWVAAFVCWAAYHIAMIARRVHAALEDTRALVHEVRTGVGHVKEQLKAHKNLLDPLVGIAGAVGRRVERAVEKDSA